MYETVRIMIWSHFSGETWVGDVVVNKDDNVNEQIFRMFNRVTEADVDRLSQWGYYLPSLSVNDQVTYVTRRRNRTYMVLDTGFKQI